MFGRRSPATPAVVVTSAGISPDDERKARERRYLITMLIRTISFVLAVVLPIPLIWKLPAVILAIVLPWLAVSVANAGPVRPQTGAAPPPVTERDKQPPPPPKPLTGTIVIDLSEDDADQWRTSGR